VIGFTPIVLMLRELPLVGCALAPDWSRRRGVSPSVARPQGNQAAVIGRSHRADRARRRLVIKGIIGLVS
jgi:hypothetical protein